ncbi:unnamed protein product [Arabidopsis halleri]
MTERYSAGSSRRGPVEAERHRFSSIGVDTGFAETILVRCRRSLMYLV